MNSVRSNNISLKYQWYKPPGCKYIGIRKVKFVAKFQIICFSFNYIYYLTQNGKIYIKEKDFFWKCFKDEFKLNYFAFEKKINQGLSRVFAACIVIYITS